MIGNMIKAKVMIEGTRPLLFHAFTPDALPLDRKERSGVAGNDPEEWKRTVLFDALTRQLYLPSSYVFGCIREAAKYTKQGRSNYQNRVAATLLVEEERVYVEDRFLPEKLTSDPDQSVYLDIRGVRNPSTRARNVRYRVACSSGWRIKFHIIWDRTIISKEIMLAILHDAGTLNGIGNGRGIGMGRFKVRNFSTVTFEIDRFSESGLTLGVSNA